MTEATDGGGGRRGRGWRIAGWGGAALLLLAPLVAMQLTDEVRWTASDFVFAGVLFGSVGLGLELAVRRTRNLAYRAAAGFALAAGFLMTWINGAVGLIGGEAEAANALALGVVAVAVIGAVAALGCPAGMARAMAATALAQLLLPLLAWAQGVGSRVLAGAPEVFALTAIFTGMWLLSAWLFRRAAAG